MIFAPPRLPSHHHTSYGRGESKGSGGSGHVNPPNDSDESSDEEVVLVDRTLSSDVFVAHAAHMRRRMYVHSPSLGGAQQQYKLLNDTGASFSAVSKRLAEQHHLHIYPPLLSEPQYIKLAEKDSQVDRLGYVYLDVTVGFVGGQPREPFRCRQKFEVMNMAYPFILGVDLLPFVFPRDEIMNYLMLPPLYPPLPLYTPPLTPTFPLLQ